MACRAQIIRRSGSNASICILEFSIAVNDKWPTKVMNCLSPLDVKVVLAKQKYTGTVLHCNGFKTTWSAALGSIAARPTVWIVALDFL